MGNNVRNAHITRNYGRDGAYALHGRTRTPSLGARRTLVYRSMRARRAKLTPASQAKQKRTAVKTAEGWIGGGA